MRLLLVNYEYPPLGGGAATATQQIARSLSRAGHAVTVLTAACPGGVAVEFDEGVSVLRLRSMRRHADRSSFIEMAGFVARALLRVGQVIRDVRPDGCIIFFSLPCGPIGWWARLRYRVPYVISLRGGDVPGAERGIVAMHRLLAPLRRRILRDAIRVVANSPGLRALSEAVDPYPVSMIPNGVDCSQFRPQPERHHRDGFVFLFVGRLNDQKNVGLLLSAFADLCADEGLCCLRIVGDGPMRNSLRSLAGALGIADRVQWLGWLSRQDLRECYCAADCLVNPSLYEGMPNVVLEAMACALPVIVSNVAGNRDVVVDRDTGIVFASDDRKALHAAMLRIVRSPELRERLGQRARLDVRDRYSWEATADAYVRLFQRPGAEAG